ncbi:MAG: helix-turn-helix transcriptional regulator [Silvibacterium sp.]
MSRLYTPREAADVLGLGYSSLKKWIYHGKIKTIQTPGGHHRNPESEIDHLVPRNVVTDTPELRRRLARSVSGRNQFIGRITDIKIGGLFAQLRLFVGAGTSHPSSPRMKYENSA